MLAVREVYLTYPMFSSIVKSVSVPYPLASRISAMLPLSPPRMVGMVSLCCSNDSSSAADMADAVLAGLPNARDTETQVDLKMFSHTWSQAIRCYGTHLTLLEELAEITESDTWNSQWQSVW